MQTLSKTYFKQKGFEEHYYHPDGWCKQNSNLVYCFHDGKITFIVEGDNYSGINIAVPIETIESFEKLHQLLTGELLSQ